MDLACGHGLAGILFAVLEREVEQVVLMDRSRPPAFQAIMQAVEKVAPWALHKVRAGSHRCGGHQRSSLDLQGLWVISTYCCCR